MTQNRGLRWNRVVMEERATMDAACQQLTAQVVVQLDQWHLWHGWTQLQACLERVVTRVEARTPVVTRQATRLAAGLRPRATRPKADCWRWSWWTCWMRWRPRASVGSRPRSSGWRAGARVLLAAWADAVQLSSAVERWHSILRPHLALLAVWQNHRVFTYCYILTNELS